MVNETIFNMSKEIAFTRKIKVRQIEENYCENYKYLNDLPCNLCLKIVGSKRPIGIGWGIFEGKVQEQGIRLCNDCYNLTKE